MLESLLRPKTAEKKPWDVFFIAIFFSIIGVAFSLQLFPSQASVFSVSLITIMFMPFFQKLFAGEEKKDYKQHNNNLQRARQPLLFFWPFLTEPLGCAHLYWKVTGQFIVFFFFYREQLLEKWHEHNREAAYASS